MLSERGRTQDAGKRMSAADGHAILLCVCLAIVVVGPGAAWCQDKPAEKPALEAVRSAELEQLLKEGKDVAEYAKTVTAEVLLSNLAAALLSDDFDVRFNAMGYLLADEAPSDARILPFVQKVGRKMVDNYLHDTRETAECWWPLIRLLGKYPDINSVPILLFAADHRHVRTGEIRDIVGSMVIRDPIDFLDDIAKSLKACTGGQIGDIPEGMRWWNRKERDELLAQWNAWWEKNKAEESGKIAPVKDEEVLALLQKVAGKDNASAVDALDTLDNMEQQRRLSALAYALGHEPYRDTALAIIRDRSRDWPKDRRLVPFLAECIRKSTGATLMYAAWAARLIPDRALLPALMEIALESEYAEERMVGGEGGSAETIYRSAFAEVAQALYVITNGEIGLEEIRTDIPFPEEERKKLITEWKAWWEKNKPEETGKIAPVKDEEVLALLQKVGGKDNEAGLHALQTLDNMEQHRRLSALAYALGQKAYRDAALEIIRDRSRDWPKDRRLVPFLAGCIRDSSGVILMYAARAAGLIPDRALLPPLMETALESKYAEERMVGGEGASTEFIYRSVFAEVAQALYVITNGEIGLKFVRTDIPFPDKERQRLITEWKAWWEENKPQATDESTGDGKPAEDDGTAKTEDSNEN